MSSSTSASDRALRMRCDLGAQVLLRVLQRVLDERRILTGERAAQLFQVFIDRAGALTLMGRFLR